MCTDLVETHIIEVFLSCHLIPLDKNLGLRSIGVDEVLRGIAGKVTVSILKEDVMKCTGTLQVCAEQESQHRSNYSFIEYDVWRWEHWFDFINWCKWGIQFIEQTIIFA